MEMIDEGREDAEDAGSAKGMSFVAELIESAAGDARLQFSPLDDFWQQGTASEQIMMMKSEACIHAQVSQNMHKRLRTQELACVLMLQCHIPCTFFAVSAPTPCTPTLCYSSCHVMYK
jgi:hypothetical protein